MVGSDSNRRREIDNGGGRQVGGREAWDQCADEVPYLSSRLSAEAEIKRPSTLTEETVADGQEVPTSQGRVVYRGAAYAVGAARGREPLSMYITERREEELTADDESRDHKRASEDEHRLHVGSEWQIRKGENRCLAKRSRRECSPGTSYA